MMYYKFYELAAKAGIDIHTKPSSKDQTEYFHGDKAEFLYEFAELIVRECIGLCQESIDDGCVEAEEPMRKIKEHFGVE